MVVDGQLWPKFFRSSICLNFPNQLREVLYHSYTIKYITRKPTFSDTEDLSHTPIIQSGKNTNDELLKQFSQVSFLNDFPFTSINKESID